MGLSRLSQKCRGCPFVSKCNYKKMETLAYIEPATQAAAQPFGAEVLVKHDYRDIKVAENTMITIDVEEIKRQMEKDFYRKAGLGLEFGA